MTHARDIECDDLPLGHPARDGLEQLDIATDPVEEQQRNSDAIPGLMTNAQRLTVKVQHLRCEAAPAAPRSLVDKVITFEQARDDHGSRRGPWRSPPIPWQSTAPFLHLRARGLDAGSPALLGEGSCIAGVNV